LKTYQLFYLGDLSVRCVDKENGSELVTDAPKESQGKGENFSPTDLLALSLGMCVLTLMGIAAKKLGVDLSDTRAELKKEMTSKPVRKVSYLGIAVHCPRDFPEDVKKQIEHAAIHCPVHNSLDPEITQEFHFHWGS